MEVIYLVVEVVLYVADSLFLLLLGRNEQIGGEYLVLLKSLRAVKSDGIQLFDAVYLVVPPRYADDVFAVCRIDIYRFPFHAEAPSLQRNVIPDVEGIHKLAQESVPLDPLPDLYRDDVALQCRRTSHTIYARYGRNHYHVTPPRQQRTDGFEPQTVYFVVYGEVFFYIGVACREVCFGLVIVVIRHIILHGIVGEEAPHLLIQLGSEGLVVAENQCRAVRIGYNIGDGEGLSRPGNAEQNLRLVAFLKSFGELPYRLRLIASGLEFGCQFEILHKCKSTKNIPCRAERLPFCVMALFYLD